MVGYIALFPALEIHGGGHGARDRSAGANPVAGALYKTHNRLSENTDARLCASDTPVSPCVTPIRGRCLGASSFPSGMLLVTAPNKISRPVIFHDLGTRTCLYPYRGATFETSGYHRTSRRWMCDAALVPLFAPGPQSSFPRALPERNSLVRIRWKLPAIRLFSPW